MFTNNEWESDDKEGIKQFFYKKEDAEDEYEYATTWTIKSDETVARNEVVIPYTGKVKQEEDMLDRAMKIHIPGDMTFLHGSTCPVPCWIHLRQR